MRKITAVHYVPKPGGGVAAPGETFNPTVAAEFTDAQIARLLKIGAIMIEDSDRFESAAGVAQDFAETPQTAAEAEPVDAEEDNEPEPEPPEIDAMDGIVQADEAPEEPQKKPRAGRRKAK